MHQYFLDPIIQSRVMMSLEPIPGHRGHKAKRNPGWPIMDIMHFLNYTKQKQHSPACLWFSFLNITIRRCCAHFQSTATASCNWDKIIGIISLYTMAQLTSVGQSNYTGWWVRGSFWNLHVIHVRMGMTTLHRNESKHVRNTCLTDVSKCISHGQGCFKD